MSSSSSSNQNIINLSNTNQNEIKNYFWLQCSCASQNNLIHVINSLRKEKLSGQSPNLKMLRNHNDFKINSPNLQEKIKQENYPHYSKGICTLSIHGSKLTNVCTFIKASHYWPLPCILYHIRTSTHYHKIKDPWYIKTSP